MLPFLKNKQYKNASLVIQERRPDSEDSALEKDDDAALHAAAQDILRAVESKDYKHLALALRAAFQIIDSEPHVEGEHMGDEK